MHAILISKITDMLLKLSDEQLRYLAIFIQKRFDI